MSAYVFTDAQMVDCRRFLGYPIYGLGHVVFPMPWYFKFYLAMEYKLANMTTSEAHVVINTYLANLYSLEAAIVTASANLDTDQAAVWTHNKNEVRDREGLFDDWRRRFCRYLGVPPGPGLEQSSNNIALVV